MNISLLGFTIMLHLFDIGAHPACWNFTLLRISVMVMGDPDERDWFWAGCLLNVSWESPAYEEDGTLLWESHTVVEALFIPLYQRGGNEADDTEQEVEPLN